MNKKDILQALTTLRKDSKQRKFSQSLDLIITLKGLNIKKPEEQVEFFTTLPHQAGKKKKICAIVGPELLDKAKEVMDKVITVPDFDQFKDKKALKKLAEEYDFFVAQADIMPKVAGAFGKALGPRGKMPNPKAGQIVPPKAPLQPVYDKLQKTVKLVAKKQLAIQVLIGTESMSDEAITENILTIYDQVINHLPAEKNNVKDVYVKFTMGKPVKL